jgi:hypothetical protein
LVLVQRKIGGSQMAILREKRSHQPSTLFRNRLSCGLLLVITAVISLSSCFPLEPGYVLPTADINLSRIATLEPIPTVTYGEDSHPQAPLLELAHLATNTINLYDPLELEILTDITTENPFNPDELKITVEFRSASGKKVEVGAFWYQEFDYISRKFTDAPSWKVRFTPTETGSWIAIARIPHLGVSSPPVQFEVVESDKHGFVRINASNSRYFEFDDGTFFFPIGMNMAWWSGAGDALSDYEKWMDLLAANGGNTIRVWMAEWSFGIEWNNTPLGDYSNRLQRAWLLDQIFIMAEERDIYIILVLLNCADFNNWQTNGWNGNPYNAALGGPLERPAWFVTDPEARYLTQRRLRYIINRWGYSPNLLAWEWWNEANLAPFTDQTLIPWYQEMTAVMHSQNINRHLISTSYAIQDISPIWDLPEIDIIQKHEYAHQTGVEKKDLADRALADFRRLADSAPEKPILLGEFGYGNEGYDRDLDKTGIHLHNGLWATTFAGYAGSGLYWYWDVYIERYQAWYHFRGLERFLDDIDLSEYEPTSPLLISGPDGSAGNAVGMGLRGEDILIWLRSDAYTVQACERSWKDAGFPDVYSCTQPFLKDQTLTIQDIASGVYTVTWYDPQRAVWLDAAQIKTSESKLFIPIPDFRKDLAASVYFTE